MRSRNPLRPPGTKRFALNTFTVVLLIAPATAATIAAPPPQTAPAVQQAATAPATQKMRQIDEKAADLINRAFEAYAALQTYRDEGHIKFNMSMSGMQQTTTIRVQCTYKRPNKVLASGSMLEIRCDGKDLWLISADRKRYMRKPPEALTSSLFEGDMPPLFESFMGGSPVMTVLFSPEKLKDTVQNVREMRYADTTKIGPYECHHIVIVPEPVSMPKPGPPGSQAASKFGLKVDLYLDTQTNLLVQADIDMSDFFRKMGEEMPMGQIERATYQFVTGKVTANQPIPDEVFAFKPTDDAKEVKSIMAVIFGEKMAQMQRDEAEEFKELLHKPAPDFQLQDLDGKKVKLSDYTGKVVVLDFWATWCPPCRTELPHLQKIQEEFADQGVVVLGINTEPPEMAEKVREFVKKEGLTFRILQGTPDVSEAYKVTGIPETVIIDRKGILRAVHVGFGPGAEDELREDIRKVLAGKLLPASRPATAPATQPQD